ncbi:MAG: hypothetical protein M3529_14435 [Actinomycetota bacterium]|nr:hypothetical protein [Actinomycetota bacterium]
MLLSEQTGARPNRLSGCESHTPAVDWEVHRAHAAPLLGVFPTTVQPGHAPVVAVNADLHVRADHTIRVRQETTPAQIAQALERGVKRAIEESDLEGDRLRSRSDEEATLTAELLQELNRETNDTMEKTNPTIKPKIV